MQDQPVYQLLTQTFREVFDDPNIVLLPSTTAADIDGWDSVGHVNLVLALEARLGVKFTISEVESLHNVGEMAGLVEYKLETAARGVTT